MLISQAGDDQGVALAATGGVVDVSHLGTIEEISK
jgi:hypothetical protein